MAELNGSGMNGEIMEPVVERNYDATRREIVCV